MLDPMSVPVPGPEEHLKTSLKLGFKLGVFANFVFYKYIFI